MTKTRLVYLFCALLFLGVVFVLSDRGRSSGDRASGRVLSQGDIGEIAKVKLENREKTTEIALQDGSWVVLAREGYPADSGKVRAFLLRLFDLSLTQLVTSDSGKYDILGVSDESVKKNGVRVTLFDGSGKELGGAILGDARKRGEGRYLRKVGSADVFLVSELSLPDLSPSYWLNTEVVNILPSQVKRVQHFLSAEGVTKLEFELIREGVAGSVRVSGEGLDSISQEKIDEVVGSYQAIQLVDVLPAADEKWRGVKFDGQSIVQLTSGLVYTLSTAVLEGKNFLKVQVSYDASLAAQLKSEWEKKHEEERTQKAEDVAKEKDGAKEGEAAKLSVPLSSDSQALDLQKRFAPWVFEVLSFQGEKLRRTQSSLMKQEEGGDEGGGDQSEGSEAE